VTHRAQLVWAHLTRIAANQPPIDPRRLISGLVGALSLVSRQTAHPAAREDFANSFAPAAGPDVKNSTHCNESLQNNLPYNHPSNEIMQMLKNELHPLTEA